MSLKAVMHTRFFPDGAIKPLAMAIAFMAWFRAPAPIACISTLPFSLNTLASAQATELGFDFVPTFNVSIYYIFPFFVLTINIMYLN
jgi:hypothetical protein